jgi:hypothetical protein
VLGGPSYLPIANVNLGQLSSHYYEFGRWAHKADSEAEWELLKSFLPHHLILVRAHPLFCRRRS